MKPSVLLTLLVIILASPLDAQVDSVNVTVINRTDMAITITPSDPIHAFAGDSVVFSAIAVDTVTGDTVNVSVQWTSDNPAVVTIDPVTGVARFLSRGSARIFVDVERILTFLIMEVLDDGTLEEIFVPERSAYYAATGIIPQRKTLRIARGEVGRICIYLVDFVGVRFRSGPLCPAWVPGLPGAPGPVPIDFSLTVG